MPAKLTNTTVRDLRTLFQIGPIGTSTDAHLLEQFRSEGPSAEAAFATLVTRHGPMVLRVCRGVLNDEHDAQDAFQATFLVLVRKAASVRNMSSVASWLYGVAHRVASRAKVNAARRRSLEREAATMIIGRQHDSDDGLAEDLFAEHSALDDEIRRLPEKYRAAIVLCYLEGLTQEQAAQQLGWPSGTVRGRLSRARDLLRARLSRRGLVVPGGALATTGFTPRHASASVVPAALVDSTVRSAVLMASGKSTAFAAASGGIAGLVDATVKAMSYSRLKWPLALLGLGLVTTSGAGLSAYYEPNTAPPPAATPIEAPKPPDTPVAASTKAAAVTKAETPPVVEEVAKNVPEPVQVPLRATNATVYPLRGISIDGDLRDWPKQIKRHLIAKSNGQGEKNRALAAGEGDSAPPASFSAGYDPEKQQLYVAVIAPDGLPVLDHRDPWHTDAVEVFVDGLRADRLIERMPSGDWKSSLQAETMPALQYAAIPDPGRIYGFESEANPALLYGDIRKTTTTMAWTRRNGVIIYEWAIQVFDRYPDQPAKLQPGKRIGFDVAVLDQNFPAASPANQSPAYEKLPSYTCWAPWKVFKGFDSGTLGELVLAPAPSVGVDGPPPSATQALEQPRPKGQISVVRRDPPPLN